MPVSADTLRTHIDYTAWASQYLLDAAAKLTPGELTHDFKTADRTVLDTLVHTFAADRAWLRRLLGETPGPFIEPADRDFARLREAWPALYRAWKEWAAPLTDARALAECSYRDRAGNPYTTPVWQIVMHVVNHGTHHRGQVSGFIRAMGHTPPEIDLIDYYRMQAAGSRTAAS